MSKNYRVIGARADRRIAAAAERAGLSVREYVRREIEYSGGVYPAAARLNVSKQWIYNFLKANDLVLSHVVRVDDRAIGERG